MYTLMVFLKSRWLEIAIVAIAFQFITAAVSVFLSDSPFLMGLTGIMFLLLIGLVTSAAEFIRKKKKTIGEGDALSIPRRGIIFTIGLKSELAGSTIIKVLEKLSPQYCGFIGTDKTFEAGIGKLIAQDFRLKEGFYREKIVAQQTLRKLKRILHNLSNG